MIHSPTCNKIGVIQSRGNLLTEQNLPLCSQQYIATKTKRTEIKTHRDEGFLFLLSHYLCQSLNNNFLQRLAPSDMMKTTLPTPQMLLQLKFLNTHFSLSIE